jgi:hypothetical protein
MCFSETLSFINAGILIIGSFFVYPKYKLSIILIFLALKDLIQGFLYKFQNNETLENNLTVLSWIHICFQPLFVNIFMSNFSKNKNNYWNIIFIISFLYGIFALTTLKKFDIQNDPNCSISNNGTDIESLLSILQFREKNKFNDFCAKETSSYIGKYHIAYKFNRDTDILLFPVMYLILMIIPSLFTKSRILGIIWALFISIIYIFFNNVGEGEKAAIWCFLSIIFFLPISIFNKQVSDFLKYLT